MAFALQQARHNQVSQYYFGYLSDAAAKLESALSRLQSSESSLDALALATDIAHRIKGNAAMYGYTELGLSAAKLETFLRTQNNNIDEALIAPKIVTFMGDIQNICQGLGQAQTPAWGDAIPTPDTLTVKKPHLKSVPQEAAGPSDRKSIIVAYRDTWLCELMASLLEPEFTVISCSTENELALALRFPSIDMLVLENSFGEISGLERIKTLKASRSTNKLPIFLALDPNSPEAIAEAISLGVEGFAEDKHEILDIVNSTKGFLKQPAKRVLVVDDDPVVREILTHALKAAGMTVDTAEDGLEALNYLSDETPDLVLLDRFMPRLEGGTVLYEIQQKINLKSIPVLILTSMVNQGEAQSWFARGAADFIPKPFDPEEVIMRVKQHLDRRQNAL